MPSADNIRPTVVVIEDDGDVREALDSLFRSVGLDVKLFSSAKEYAAGDREIRPGCMVLDVRLPGQNGLDFYDDLVKTGTSPPVVFISGHADVPMSVRAMKAGAVEFLTKPVRDQDLLDAVHLAIERDRTQRNTGRAVARIWANYEALTPREREIMALVIAGYRNKQIAAEMSVGEATVKLHRGASDAKNANPVGGGAGVDGRRTWAWRNNTAALDLGLSNLHFLFQRPHATPVEAAYRTGLQSGRWRESSNAMRISPA